MLNLKYSLHFLFQHINLNIPLLNLQLLNQIMHSMIIPQIINLSISYELLLLNNHIIFSKVQDVSMDFLIVYESIGFLFLKIECNLFMTIIPIFLNVSPPFPSFDKQSTIPLISLNLNNQIFLISPMCSIFALLITLYCIGSIYQSIFHSAHSFEQSYLESIDNSQMISIPFMGQIYQKVYMLM